MASYDTHYMTHCLTLAQLGRGNVHPNPMVGSVVLNAQGKLVGEGYHTYYGGPHAEVVALEQAGADAKGGTLYVNLEPCSHEGKTPPCAKAVIDAGVRRVVYGLKDPNPKVAGQGITMLNEAGIDVDGPILEKACHYLNEAFFKFMDTQRPFVMLKHALTLDGRIATRTGDSQWITHPQARAWVHQLRAQSDAVLTTANTVLNDNCQLTVRDAPILGKPPARIVLDRQRRLHPKHFEIFNHLDTHGPVWLVTGKGQQEHPHKALAQSMGIQLLEVSETGQGLDLIELVERLGKEPFTQICVEAGSRLAGSLLQHKLVDKYWLFYGNTLVGDPYAVPGFLGAPVQKLRDAQNIWIRHQTQLGQNVVIEAYPAQ